MEKQQLLRDPDIEPTNEVIAKGLGEAYDAYIKFFNGLEDHGTDGKTKVFPVGFRFGF